MFILILILMIIRMMFVSAARGNMEGLELRRLKVEELQIKKVK